MLLEDNQQFKFEVVITRIYMTFSSMYLGLFYVILIVLGAIIWKILKELNYLKRKQELKKLHKKGAKMKKNSSGHIVPRCPISCHDRIDILLNKICA
jgi:hypothetical protein